MFSSMYVHEPDQALKETLALERKRDVMIAIVELKKVFPDKMVVDQVGMLHDFNIAVQNVLENHDASHPAGNYDIHEKLVDDMLTWMHEENFVLILVEFDYHRDEYTTTITFCEDDSHKGFSYHQRLNQPPDVTKVVEAFCALAPANLKVRINAALGCTAVVGAQPPS